MKAIPGLPVTPNMWKAWKKIGFQKYELKPEVVREGRVWMIYNDGKSWYCVWVPAGPRTSETVTSCYDGTNCETMSECMGYVAAWENLSPAAEQAAILGIGAAPAAA